MSPETAYYLALILAAQVRCMGMSAANDARKAQGLSPAYAEDHFASEAQHLETLAGQAINAQ